MRAIVEMDGCQEVLGNRNQQDMDLTAFELSHQGFHEISITPSKSSHAAYMCGTAIGRKATHTNYSVEGHQWIFIGKVYV